MIYGSNILTDFDKSSALEWLETNGLGGYASGTVSGALTRRYHGLLIAALEPPVKRTVLLSKLDETIVTDDKKTGARQRYELGANQYPGAVHPTGFRYLNSFERNAFPVFSYTAGNVSFTKTIAAVHEENTTVVLYEVAAESEDFTLELLPLASSRDHHGICHANPALGRQYLFEEGLYRTVNYHGGAELFVLVPGSEFVESQGWYYNLEYLRELERGLEFMEDLYAHGNFVIKLRKGDRLGVIISTEDPAGRDAFALFAAEEKRRQTLQLKFPEEHAALPRLIRAADQFIVRRDKLHTVIAGYPWFSDWGRDTMISLPGLCLTTGRLDIAREILRQFSLFVSEGMLPNRFPDHGEVPEYNTFDATLWFFHATYQYYLASGDRDLIQDLMPALSDIVDWHLRGTRYGIGVDPTDQLLRGGEPGVQLTWMDAKVGDWVVTPRMGKPVEINALWYNALRIMETFCKLLEMDDREKELAHMAGVVYERFQTAFWNSEYNCLYDYIDDTAHPEVRPNQLYAVSLPFPLLKGVRARAVVNIVRDKLLTPTGLRSLAPDAPGYIGKCVGPPLQRDGAYHQGTVWSYLMGAYIDALYAVEGDAARTEATALVTSCCTNLDEACVGSISEIFDGDWPHAPRGCIAQAWSVAELLRVMVKYNLINSP